MGITMLMTTELENSYIDLRFSPHGASAHSKELRAFEIGDRGIVGGDRVERYQGLLSGSPQLVPSARPASRRPDKRQPRS